MLSQQQLKEQVAQAAVEHILPLLKKNSVLGVGTGSTVDLFIDALAPYRERFLATCSSSERSTQRLQQHGFQVLDLNTVESMPVYVDGADEIDEQLNMLKGGGGALTREKIVASVAERFLCIADESKLVNVLGNFPLPVEVIPMALASVSRRLAALGGKPKQREGFVTDNGCWILDVSGLAITAPAEMESIINDIPGVVTCGLFARSAADTALLSTQQGIRTLSRSA